MWRGFHIPAYALRASLEARRRFMCTHGPSFLAGTPEVEALATQKGIKPLTLSDIIALNLGGSRVAAKSFIQALVIFLKNKDLGRPSLTHVVKALLELLLDNRILNEVSIKELVKVFGKPILLSSLSELQGLLF